MHCLFLMCFMFKILNLNHKGGKVATTYNYKWYSWLLIDLQQELEKCCKCAVKQLHCKDLTSDKVKGWFLPLTKSRDWFLTRQGFIHWWKPWRRAESSACRISQALHQHSELIGVTPHRYLIWTLTQPSCRCVARLSMDTNWTRATRTPLKYTVFQKCIKMTPPTDCLNYWLPLLQVGKGAGLHSCSSIRPHK